MKIGNPRNLWLVGVATASLLTGTALWEGKRLNVYKDIGGIPTVCYGHTGPEVKMGQLYNEQQCRDLLRKDLKKHSDGVLACITKPLEVRQFNAFTMMAFNVGVSGFCGSRAARLFNEGKPDLACRAIANGPDGRPAWSYVNQKFVQGLYNRRLHEREMCLGGSNEME